MSVLGEKNRQVRPDFSLKNIFEGCRERRDGSDYPMKVQIRVWQVTSSYGERSWAKQLTYLGAVSLVRSLRCGIGGFTGAFDGRR